jgi:PEP-CTERM motif-containing protein/uncharacterized protein DUF642
MRSNILSSVALAASMALAIGSAAHATTNLVTNGDFSSGPSANAQFGTGFGGQTVTGWTGGNGYQLYFVGGTQTTTSAVSQYNTGLEYFHPSASTLSPNGGNFVALDGDSSVRASISQTLTGLNTTQTYALTFDWAAGQLINRVGDITEQLQVSFGSDVQLTSILSVPSTAFSGWNVVTMYFKPTSSTETLTFLSLGTPNGLPPMALLDGVSLTAVPEPATWAMMLIGFGGLGAMIRRRRPTMVAA